MSPEYQQLRQQADRLYNHFNDVMDHSSMGGLAPDIRNIVEDCEMSKNPHSIEDRIKRVVEQLKQLRHGETAMNEVGHLDELIRNYEELRGQVKKLPNY